MNRKSRFVTVVAAGICLLAAARAQAPTLKDSIAQYEQEVAKARSGHKTRELILYLNLLASVYRESGQLQKALDCLNEALPIEQQANGALGQAMTFNTMGQVYTDLGQEEKALSYLNQALPLWQTAGHRTGEANALTSIGRVYENLGQHEEALKNLNDAMEIWHDIDNPDTAMAADAGPSERSGRLARRMEAAREKFTAAANINIVNASAIGEAGTLDGLGRTYADEGQGREALKYFEKSLPIFQQSGERVGEALVLNDMGPAYAEIGQKQKALESLNQALAIWREIGSRQGEALTLNDIGRVYRDLGQQQSAMDYYNQALPIWREVGNRNGEALALSDIGRAYADLGQPRKALDYANQALPIFHETGSRRGEAMTLNNMGRDQTDLGDPAEAMKLELQALGIWRDAKDQRNEAQDLMTIAWSYAALGQPESSLASALAALGLAKAVGDPEVEGAIETSLMIGFRKQHHLEEAIFFGLEAVNSYQSIRKNIAGLDKSLQAGFAQSKSGAYRTLAELLIEAGRLGDAEQILDLLKEQELNDLVPGSGPGAGAMETPRLSPVQLEIESLLPNLEKKARNIEEWNLEAAQLQANPARAATDNERLKTLAANLEEAKSAIRDRFDHTIVPELDKQSTSGQPTAGSTQSYLQNSLAKLGPNVIGIRILLGEDHAFAIVVTANSRRKFQLSASPADLRMKAFEALKAIGSPSTDPRPQLNQLYTLIVAPLEGELKTLEVASGAQENVPTLLWSLDDALRYVPMGALYDGNRYLVERFHNVLFTPESYGHIADAPIQTGHPPRALAMGLSKSYNGMPALPGVIPELDSVAHDPSYPDSHGPIEGTILPDEKFTLAALKTALGSGSGFPVVHIASHFVLVAGTGDEPFLLMGGNNAGDAKGFEWNLSDMENSPVIFRGTRLLTLSACSTAKDYKSRNGFEMDGLGMIAQQKEAEAVLATLWDVNDFSTSKIMSDFYDRWVKNPARGKAEALRQAQLAFLHGAATGAAADTGRGFEPVGPSPTRTSSLGYAHPYYWAPFVLIGNYQ
ncbi:MAG TPA: tetratricopeptide repeat protein [Terracidiphilus sp.]|nr:tetratricopeptide repeat protein [Terracidiphilus sp.]